MTGSTEDALKVPLQSDHASARAALAGACSKSQQRLAKCLASDSGSLPCPAAVEALALVTCCHGEVSTCLSTGTSALVAQL